MEYSCRVCLRSFQRCATFLPCRLRARVATAKAVSAQSAVVGGSKCGQRSCGISAATATTAAVPRREEQSLLFPPSAWAGRNKKAFPFIGAGNLGGHKHRNLMRQITLRASGAPFSTGKVPLSEKSAAPLCFVVALLANEHKGTPLCVRGGRNGTEDPPGGRREAHPTRKGRVKGIASRGRARWELLGEARQCPEWGRKLPTDRPA